MSYTHIKTRFISLCRTYTQLRHAQLVSRVAAPTLQHRCLCSNVVDPDDMTPPIPEYIDRGPDERIKDKRARLLYQSRKRGMLENGLLLSTFAAKFLDKLDNEQLRLYDTLINKPTNDWDIYYWITENKPTPPEYDNSVMEMLKTHAKNKERDVRIRQPDLYTSSS